MLLIKPIETPRLRIRSWTRQDTAFTLSLWGDSQNGHYMSDPTLEHMDEKYLQCVAEMEDNPEGYYMVAELRETGACVGTCCAFPQNEGVYDIGYCIDKAHWQEGLGSEMIAALIEWIKTNGGHSITAEMADANAASRALLAKYGFAPTKPTRYKKWGEETYFDAHIYQLYLSK